MDTIVVLQVAVVMVMLSVLVSSLLIRKLRTKTKAHEKELLELYARVHALESTRDQA